MHDLEGFDGTEKMTNARRVASIIMFKEMMEAKYPEVMFHFSVWDDALEQLDLLHLLIHEIDIEPREDFTKRIATSKNPSFRWDWRTKVMAGIF